MFESSGSVVCGPKLSLRMGSRGTERGLRRGSSIEGAFSQLMEAVRMEEEEEERDSEDK